MDWRHMLHTTVYCAATSPCGKFVAVGNNFGFIAIFDLLTALSPKVLQQENYVSKPMFVFSALDGPVNALISTKQYLLSGGSGPIAAWKWSDLTNLKAVKSFSLITVGASNTNSNEEDSNCLCYDDVSGVLYSGGSSCTVTAFDIGTGKCVNHHHGHKQFIHDVTLASDHLVTASEDGSVKVWDLRHQACVQTLEPHKYKEVTRPSFGSWIGCVAADSTGEWLACGGGPIAALWHLRSATMVSMLQGFSTSSEFVPHTLSFYEDEIIAGGNQPILHRWRSNGQHKAAIPCSISNIFCASFKSSPQKSTPLVVTGTSSKVDVFTTLGYKGISLSLH